MKITALLIVTTAVTAAKSQIPKPGFGDKGCPDRSVLAENVDISGGDFIEVQQLPSFGNGPVYTVRVYGDGRLQWHGAKAVRTVGDASENVDMAQSKAIIANALKLGFRGLCEEYVMRGFDGGISITKLSIGGQYKTVTNTGPSNAPSWLYKVQQQIAALPAVKNLIGVEPNHPRLKR